jgi:hypothetical protein
MTRLDTLRFHWALFRARLAARCMQHYATLALAFVAEARSYLPSEITSHE